MSYVPFAVPLAALAWVVVARPPAGALALAALVALALELPAGLLLSAEGGIECPNGCSTAQDLLQGAFFLALPLTVIILAVAAVVRRVRS